LYDGIRRRASSPRIFAVNRALAQVISLRRDISIVTGEEVVLFTMF